MKNYEQFIQSFTKLISFKSKKSLPDGDMPFGKEIYGALNYVLSLGKEFGFETINYDNYIGEIDFGEGQEIGIIGHIDVVPEGANWSTDPFTLTFKDGIYYARGVQDDKAPLLLCLFALKELKDAGIKVNKKFRFIVGCDEECGWEDIDYFKTKSAFPKYGFSPDGNFPVSYAEKGINKIIFTLPKLKRFKNLKGGTVFNAVPGFASVEAEEGAIDSNLLKKHGLTANGNIIESVGKSCHGSRPQLGKNAIKPLFEYMLDMGEDLKSTVDYVFNDKKKLSEIKTEQGFVTFSPNIAETKEDGSIKLYCDFRVPAPKYLEDLLPIFKSFGIEFEAKKKRDPLLVKKDGVFVKILLNAYKTATGEDGEPISQSGGTFAYVFEQGCAFGPEFIGEDSSIHEADEHISEENIKKLYDIYKSAIFSFATSEDIK